jgi:hypothetical protein
MADYTDAKSGVGAVFPEHAIDSEHQRLEPLLGPSELVTRHLFGIPLVSQIKDPFTGKPMVMTPEMTKDIIEGAVQQAEILTGIDIFPVIRNEKQPFDKQAFASFGYMQLQHRPATSISKVSITPANGLDVYILPLEWLETAYLVRGQINIIPMTVAFSGLSGMAPVSSSGGSWFLSVLGNRQWIPAFWQIQYTSGFRDSMVPRVINDLVGTIAATEILSMLATTGARNQSHSLGIDGMSQSVSTPGPATYQVRLSELEAKKKSLINKVKSLYSLKIFSSHL